MVFKFPFGELVMTIIASWGLRWKELQVKAVNGQSLLRLIA